jgi:hypothetical protein
MAVTDTLPSRDDGDIPDTSPVPLSPEWESGTLVPTIRSCIDPPARDTAKIDHRDKPNRASLSVWGHPNGRTSPKCGWGATVRLPPATVSFILLSLPFALVLVSLLGLLVGAMALAAKDNDKRLAALATGVNLLPLISLIVSLRTLSA